VRHPLKIRRPRKRKRKRSGKRNERRDEGRAMSLGKREGSGKRKRKKAAGTVVGMAVAVARAEVVTTVDKATGRVDVKREEMRGAEVEEDTTAAAGRLRDHLLTLLTLGQIELAPSDIAATVLTIIEAIVDRMMTMQLQIRDQTAIAQPTFTIGNHRSRLLRFGTQFVFHEL